ncbi:hypothetical protein [uncultured Leclercia sp.]|uniref:hypothetical protein n=1 Tax=uncultured Leclercia sp. TaxID=332959 RepID=UPI002591979E|nr:hypothetical protein [uncultured Leclercia sp.]
MHDFNLFERWYLDFTSDYLFPLAGLVYHEWYKLFVFFLFVAFWHQLGRVVFQNLSYVGLSTAVLEAAGRVPKQGFPTRRRAS